MLKMFPANGKPCETGKTFPGSSPNVSTMRPHPTEPDVLETATALTVLASLPIVGLAVYHALAMENDRRPGVLASVYRKVRHLAF